METTKLSTKGQIVLPKAIRESRGWRAGMEFSVEDTPKGILIRPVKPFPPTRIEDVAGCLAYKGRPKTLREMEKGPLLMAKRRHESGRY